MHLDAIARLIEQDPPRALAAVARLQSQASQSLAEVRRSVHDLRPLAMEGRSGIEALRKLVAEFQATTGVQAGVMLSGAPAALSAAHHWAWNFATAILGFANPR